MLQKAIRNPRAAALLFALLLAAQLFPVTVSADDAELSRQLPGRWAFAVYAGETEGETQDLAFLTFEKGGRASLLCSDAAGETLCDLEGTWSFGLVTGGMDRLSLTLSSAGSASGAAGAYATECTYDIYTESWDENDVRHEVLILEETGSGASPFAEFYGEDGASPISLHREEGPNRRVVNCREYVSLREARSKSSARLAKVPLGALVHAYPEAGEEGGFVLCTYHDEYGYILAEYLAPVE